MSNDNNSSNLAQEATQAETKNIIKIQVVLEYQWTSSRDLIANVDAEQIARGSSHEISLISIVESLAAKGFDLEPEQRISYRDIQKGFNVYIGKASDEALINSYMLPSMAFESSENDTDVLTLIVREASSSLSGQKPLATRQGSFGVTPEIEEKTQRQQVESTDLVKDSEYAKQSHALLSSQSLPVNEVAAKEQQSNSVRNEARPQRTSTQQTIEKQTAKSTYLDPADLKRTKERQIRFVVERVSLWRKLYNGVELGNGETVRYSLEDSAKLVGISKKSLDDYLLQLRFGRMYGFDFLKHQCDNIGVLRKFVREQKSKMKREALKQAKGESSEADECAEPNQVIEQGQDMEMEDSNSQDQSSNNLITVDKVM